MNKIHGQLIGTIKRTETVISFRFKSDINIIFEPGQFLQVIFDEDNERNSDLNKYLSFSNAPGYEYFEITKRISNSFFSQKLMSLKKGDVVLFNMPLGNCIFKDTYDKICFLIGGIGITPVISILQYIDHKKLSTDAYLIYSNKFAKDIAFKSYLDELSERNRNIHVQYTVTDCEPEDDKCMVGFINQTMIEQCIPNWRERIIYVYGSPSMVTTIKNICFEMKCAPNQMKTENFMGY